MREFVRKRFLPLVLVLAVCSSFLVVPMHAADMSGNGVQVTLKGSTLEIFQQAFNEKYQRQQNNLLNDCVNMIFRAAMWVPQWNLTVGRSAYNNGSISYMTMNDLNATCSALNSRQGAGAFEQVVLGGAMVQRIEGTDDYGIAVYVDVFSALTGGILGGGVSSQDPNILGRPQRLEVHVFWLCDPSNPGNILVANDGIVSEDIPAGEEENASTSAGIFGKFFPAEEAQANNLSRMVSREELYNRAVELRGSLSLRDGKYYIIDYMGENIYCGYDGLPYCAWPQSTSVTETHRETDVVINTDSNVQVDIEGGSEVNLDIEELIATLPDGTNVNAENIVYDDKSQTYYINTSTGNQTEGENGDIYNTYNYSYTYNIDYTSVTYIGQSAEYNKNYEAYYKLPDGRSSADLTAAELEQLNLAVDVLNYGRSADDVSLRSLYHFDGETTDDSYWNYCTDFTWNSGASLTYMDAGTFEGALYLDENVHDFTITLPSNLSTGDFTLQFRYYQSATIAPQTDSFVKLGEYTLLQTNGKQFLDGSGNVLCLTPIGTWNEFALIRHSGTIYYYLNGVKVGNVSHSLGIGNKVQFSFGDAQQTYKYFDELRVLNFALAEGGASYAPSSVPHDTNLSLVLPTDKKPIADEYWNISSSKENLFGFSFEEFCNLEGYGGTFAQKREQYSIPVRFPKFYSVTEHGEVSSGNTGLIFRNKSGITSPSQYLNISGWSGTVFTAPVGVGIGYSYYVSSSLRQFDNYIDGNASGGSYCFSLVLSDGQVCSVPFTLTNKGVSGSATFDWGKIQTTWLTYSTSGSAGRGAMYIGIIPNDSIEVLYMELCAGAETDLSAEYVSSVTEMTPEQLQSFTLAVRSDVAVTSSQIGGVRPSLPKKGMVWALVEGGTITSLQIYNGRAWEEVDGRIWTGSRWASLASYDVKLQKDLADIVGTTTAPEYEYIYTDSGFWDWWQRSWNSFTDRFFSSQPQGSEQQQHTHSYVKEVLTEASCTNAGQVRYTCSGCGDSYIEADKPLGHDFEMISETDSGYLEPTGLICSHCASTSISTEIVGAVAECTCNVCDFNWQVQAEYEYGETVYRCRRCGEEKTDTKDDRGLFTLIGSFFADAIRWIVSKLGSLVDAMAALSRLFDDFIENIKGFVGDNPLIFAAGLAMMPEELMSLIWFSIVAGIVMLVWKKFKG